MTTGAGPPGDGNDTMSGTLKIARLRADCLVTGAPEIASAVAERTTRALRNHLASAVHGAFASWLDHDDEGIWIVRRLELSVLTDTDVSADALAAAVATSLVRGLCGTLTGDGDGVNAVRFPNRAAYLGRFIVDAASGDAWSRWYYAPLVGLRVLPSSAAIRTALVEDPACGRNALAMLDDRALARVTAALTAQDVTRVLAAFASANPANGEPTDEVFAAAWSGCVRAQNAGVERGHALFALVRADCALAGPAVERAVRIILDAMPAAQAGVPSLLGQHSEMIEGMTGRAPTRDTAGSTSTTSTRFGGLFLLLRDLDELPWAAWTAGWPTPPGGTVCAVLKWLTMAACAGRAQARGVLDDAVLRTLFGIPVALTTLDASRWLRQVGADRQRILAHAVAAIDEPAIALTSQERAWFRLPRSVGIGTPCCDTLARIARGVLRGFARRLPGFADSMPEHLWRNFLAFEATIEYEEERVVVRCGRPPLHLMLALTGMTRGLVAGHDARGRPILAYPHE